MSTPRHVGQGKGALAPYRQLLIMSLASFAAMYVLMYAMVDRAANVYLNLNQLYMAGLMTAPMAILELLVMRSMYSNKRLNALVLAGCILLGSAFWAFIRQQAAISDRQFLKSMIPHHASALLMCQEASLKDPELLELCRSIVSGQQAEIDFMRTKLRGASD